MELHIAGYFQQEIGQIIGGIIAIRGLPTNGDLYPKRVPIMRGSEECACDAVRLCEFEPQAFQKRVKLIKDAHHREDSRVCNPHLKKQYHCSDTCLVCNMDKNLYDLCLQHIVNEMIKTMAH